MSSSFERELRLPLAIAAALEPATPLHTLIHNVRVGYPSRMLAGD